MGRFRDACGACGVPVVFAWWTEQVEGDLSRLADRAGLETTV